MQTFSDGQYQEELSRAMDEIQQLKILLKEKDQLLQESQTTVTQLKKKISQLAQQAKQTATKNTKTVDELQEKIKSFEENKAFVQQQSNSITNQYRGQIRDLFQQITEHQRKNEQLINELKQKNKLAEINETQYKQQSEKLVLLEKIILQVQDQSNDAKHFRDKTFQEEYNKLLTQAKKLEAKIMTVMEQNQNLRSQVSRTSLQNTNQNMCKIDQHYQQGMKIQDLQKRLYESLRRQQNWNKQKDSLQNSLKLRQQDCNRLNWQVYQLQENVADLRIRESDLQKNLEQANKKIFQMTEHLNYMLQQTPQKPIDYSQIYPTPTLNPLNQSPNTIDYVKKIAMSVNLYWDDLYYEIEGVFNLNHSNIPIDINEFLKYDWSKLKEVNFYNTKFDVDKWRTMVQNSSKFPCLQMIYLHGNSIAIVKQGDLQQFKKLKMVYFHYTDQTRGYKGSNPLNASSKQYLEKYNSNHEQKSQIFF